MKRPITSLFALLAFAGPIAVSAQQPTIHPCGTYNAMEEVFAQDPAARARYEAAQELMKNEQLPAGKSAAFEYTIPVVFHILHQGGAENVTDAECKQALDWVNMDLDRSHTDVSSVVQPFQNMFIDSDIKLVLAHKDPQGNCTSGIMHYYDSRTTWNRSGQLYAGSPLYAGYTWPASKYLNIIVVKDIVAESGQNGMVVGYTFKPNTFGTNDTRDAIVYRYNFLQNFDETRFLTHELGHWLNLSHTWGDTNDPNISCGDDGVCDTPPTKGKLGGCDNSLSGNSCAPTATCGWSSFQQNTQNIMNYSDCSINFTAGQTAVMRNALASTASGRSNLWSPTNLIGTDVDGTSPCAPRADFSSTSESYTICAGNTLTFKEYSFGGTVTGYQWSTSDASAIITDATATVTSVMFTQTGTINVSLAVTNNLGTHVKTKVVTVVDGLAQLTGPAVESFETGMLPADWKVLPSTGTSIWKHTWNAGYDGVGSFFVEGAAMPANKEVTLYSPIIDMENSPIKNITFAYAYAMRASGSFDLFKLQGTSDCGGVWHTFFTYAANQLANGSGETQATNFIPTASQWKTESLSDYAAWDHLKFSPHAQLRFVFTEGTTGNGNNFYLDAVTIPQDVGMSELKNNVSLKLYPNPTEEKVNLQFALSKASAVKISVTDVSGRQLAAIADEEFSSGRHELVINSNADLAKGIYLVNIEIDGVKMTEKLLVR